MELVITDKPTAAELLAKPHRFTHLIGHTDSDPGVPVEGHHTVPERLLLHFDDITIERKGWVRCTEDDIRAIIRFAERIPRGDVRLLVHCEAGISRSTASAYIALCVALGPGREREAYHRMLDAREEAEPNARMVTLADELLGRSGAIIEAARYRGPTLGYRV
jgi:predicted protein tyrosine phosphatase